MEWFINLDNATKITLVTVALTNTVTILTILLNYFQKKRELQNSLKIIKKQKAEERRDSVRDLHLDIVQNFAYSAGNILTSIETPLKDSTKDRKTSFGKLSEFDKAYYNMFVLLKSEEDRKIFKKFQYQVRRLAGLPKPDGTDIFEEQKELPLKIYKDLDDCLVICHNLINDLLSNSE